MSGNRPSEEYRFSYVLDEGLTILAIDDDSIQLEFCSVYLASPGVEILTACNAIDALKVLDRKTVNAVLVDYDMPGTSGVEFLRALRLHPIHRGLPVMMITGREDMASIDEAYTAGATTFMCKPVNWRLLAHHVRFMIRAHQALE